MMRVWDLVFFEGSKALFRVSLALLKTHRKKLDDLVTAISQGLIDQDVGTDEALVALRQMPDDTFDCDRLMSCAVHEISSLPRALLVKLRTHNSRRVLAHGKLEQVFVKQSRELFNLQVTLKEQCALFISTTQRAPRTTRTTHQKSRTTHHASRITHHTHHTHHAPRAPRTTRTTHHAPRTTHHAPRTTHHAPR
jgi:hypothetical protein